MPTLLSVIVDLQSARLPNWHATMSSDGEFRQIWDAYEASGDDARVHRDVQTKLGVDASAAPVLTFLRDLEAFVADEDKLLLLLSVGLGGRFETQMSFLGLLLREDVLQTGIVDMLLEKVDYGVRVGCGMENGEDLACLLLPLAVGIRGRDGCTVAGEEHPQDNPARDPLDGAHRGLHAAAGEAAQCAACVAHQSAAGRDLHIARDRKRRRQSGESFCQF